MGAAFEEVYTDEQRDAMAEAYVDRGIRPARKVVELAEAGQLVDGLEPFKVGGGDGTVRDLASKLKKRRAGKLASDVAKQPPRDAIEGLRVRLVSAIDHELTAIERAQRNARGKAAIDPERLRQVARAVREAALIPEPGKVAPPATPPREAGKRSSVTKGGLAGAILADVDRAQAGAAHDLPSSDATQGGMASEPALTQQATEGGMADSDDSPGDWVREQIDALPLPSHA